MTYCPYTTSPEARSTLGVLPRGKMSSPKRRIETDVSGLLEEEAIVWIIKVD